jgi:pyruvate dehydrogenase E2 component (dihydrolipoyllysine-residue acetyltransferase)
MKTAKLVILLALWAAAAVAEVVVLRGGTRIDLKQPPVRQGSTVLLTRRDGTLLSVPVSEIDEQATRAANAAAAAAPPAGTAAKANAETPASAARATREGPKARVKLTDADVGHYLEAPAGESSEEKKEGGAGGGAHVDVANYTKSKAGDNLIVKGTLRNQGTTAALNTRLTVSPIDEKGQMIDSAEASLSSGTIEPGRETSFSATIPVGNRAVGTMRFSPRWVSQATPAEIAASAPAQPAASRESGTPGTAGAAAPAAAAAPSAAASPAPVRTPYGQGLTYAAPAPNAPMERPPDGKTGYIPGAATPENQPKPPE